MKKNQDMIDDEIALRRVEKIIRMRIKQNEDETGKEPLRGWSQEKHEAYHKARIVECQMALDWVHLELLRRNPD